MTERQKEIESLLKAKWRIFQMMEQCQSVGQMALYETLKGQLDSINEQLDELDVMSVEQ